MRGMSSTNSMCCKIVCIAFYVPFKKKKTFSVFLSSYRNTSGSLGERKMLWEHELWATVSTASSSLPNFHKCFYNSIETRRKCFLLHLESSPGKITKNKEHLIALLIIKSPISTPREEKEYKFQFFVPSFVSFYFRIFRLLSALALINTYELIVFLAIDSFA